MTPDLTTLIDLQDIVPAASPVVVYDGNHVDSVTTTYSFCKAVATVTSRDGTGKALAWNIVISAP